jgi:hypothetical protein
MSEPFFKSGYRALYIIFFIALTLHVLFSSYVRPIRSFFEAVPPVPTRASASLQFLGDKALAYRVYGMMIQNFGDTGGRHTALKDYNYERLSKWFFLEQSLNDRAHFAPFVASYIFGASQDVSKLGPVIDYLEVVGNNAEDGRWRWLAHAVYLARFRMEDNDRALELAYKLSALDVPTMPVWAKQMPALVQMGMDENEAAYSFMVGVLKDGSDNMHPNEINYIVNTICTRVLTPAESGLDPLCIEYH